MSEKVYTQVQVHSLHSTLYIMNTGVIQEYRLTSRARYWGRKNKKKLCFFHFFFISLSLKTRFRTPRRTPLGSVLTSATAWCCWSRKWLGTGKILASLRRRWRGWLRRWGRRRWRGWTGRGRWLSWRGETVGRTV